MTTPHRPAHADKVGTIPGADPRLTLRRRLAGYAYPQNGNAHNPTPRFLWLLQADGRTVDQDSKRARLVEAARTNGAAYLAELDARTPRTTTSPPALTDPGPASPRVPALDLAPLTPGAYALHVLAAPLLPAPTPTRGDVDTLGEAVRASVAAGDVEAAMAADTVRRRLVELLPDDSGAFADREEAEHNAGRHEPNELPHACPLCAEDTGDPFGLFAYGAHTPADTVARLAALLPVACPACNHLAHDAADLDEHRGIHEEDAEELAADNAAGAAMLAEDDETEGTGAHGRCDTCGAPCDSAGCTRDRGHAVALDVDDARPEPTAADYAAAARILDRDHLRRPLSRA